MKRLPTGLIRKCGETILQLDAFTVGPESPLLVIAGPCVIENETTTLHIAERLKSMAAAAAVSLVFKASYDKANRTSLESFRGPGIAEGLRILERVRAECELPVLSDVHRISELRKAADVLDILQIPAFLCRQTDLLLAAAGTGRVINVKKGQFQAPWDMDNVVKKLHSTGNRRVILTERGTCFGYNNLVVDFRGIPVMQRTGCPVVFDATHSTQLPGGQGDRSGGQRDMAPVLARAAVAAGVDGIFMEVHPDPERALCDGPNSLRLDDVPALWKELVAIREAIFRS
jgi:2-dehydro-3-deoxyphosphooctonate aldolase (KDO 8-P synthase)